MASKILNILSKIYWFYALVIDCITDAIFGFIYKSKHEQLPPIKDPVLVMSATCIAEKIRTGQLKSEYVVKAFIDRIKEVNIIINAVVDTRYEDAIREAQWVDQLIASGEKSEEQLKNETPFLGVPYTAKECFEVKGLHQTGGLVSRKNVISSNNAPIINIMRDAGAILLGVTNTPQLCCWGETHNPVYGVTNNPYDTTRIAGGSSGGEGSVISSAGSVIGLGSDIGGSIRVPCYCCGIFGHKPTPGFVPIDGMIPDTPISLHNVNTTGPLCRYACDLLPLFKVLARNWDTHLQLDTPVDIKRLKIFYMEPSEGFPYTSKVDPELALSFHKVLNHFEKRHGIKPERVTIPEWQYVVRIFTYKMFVETSVSFSHLFADGNGRVSGLRELIKWFLRSSNFSDCSLYLMCLDNFLDKEPAFARDAEANFKALRQKFDNLLSNNGLFLYLTSPRLPSYHHQTLFNACNLIYTGIFSILGLPVTQCPLGMSSKSVPLGIQVIGNRFQDHLTLAVARDLEAAFGGWVPPCSIS